MLQAGDNDKQWETIELCLQHLIFPHKEAQKNDFSYNLSNLKENSPEVLCTMETQKPGVIPESSCPGFF